MAIGITGKFKPEGDYPLMDAEDVLMPDGSRLSNTEMGKPGNDGKDGQDGVSATHSWNGTVLTITSASGTSSADLKGDPGRDGQDGSDGKTPVKGTDYYTEADKAEFQTYLRTLFGENIVPLTQAEYDALVAAGTVDPNKYYMIVGDGE